jgi:predicted ferric reductase
MTEISKRRVLIAVMAGSIVPAVLLIQFPAFTSAKTLSLYLSAILGYIGVTSLLWSYILGAKSVMGIVFRDLAPVLSIHKWLGKYGTLAIFIHPLLVMYGYGENLLYIISPQIGTEFTTHVTFGRIAFLTCLLIWITSAILRDRIAFRPWRYLHALGYMVLPFAFLHIPDVGSHFMSSFWVKLYFFVLVVTFFVFSLLRVRDLLNINADRYRVIGNQKIRGEDPPIYILRLRPEEDRLIPSAGQYIYLKFKTVFSEAHPFSVLNDEGDGTISIAYRARGRFTKQMSELTVGESMLLTGPYGEFIPEAENPDAPMIFIAGGIGITSMLRYLIENYGYNQWLFYVNRTEASAIFIPELRALMSERLVTIFSREQDIHAGNEQGYFTAELAKKYLQDPNRHHYYLCGPSSMIRAATSELRKLGVSDSQVHTELFGW